MKTFREYTEGQATFTVDASSAWSTDDEKTATTRYEGVLKIPETGSQFPLDGVTDRSVPGISEFIQEQFFKAFGIDVDNTGLIEDAMLDNNMLYIFPGEIVTFTNREPSEEDFQDEESVASWVSEFRKR